MAKRKKKKARAPIKALRKKATKVKATGKRKVKRERAMAEPDPIREKFLIEKEGGFLLKLNNLGEQEFSTSGDPSEFVTFPSKEMAQAAIKADDLNAPLFVAGATIVPFGKYFGLDYHIDVDSAPPKMLMPVVKWLSHNPVPRKTAIKNARAVLVQYVKDTTAETKVVAEEYASKRKDYGTAIKALQKQLTTLEKDAAKTLAAHKKEDAAGKARIDAFDRRFK